MNQTSSAHPAGRAPHHPRPEPGTPVIIGWRKWDGSPHWRHEAHYLGEDRWGSWVGQLPGQRSHRPGRDFLAEHFSVQLVPPVGEWIASFNSEPEVAEIYIDLAWQVEWSPTGPVGIDMDLDVLRTRDDRGTWLDDEDEWHEHGVQFGYPTSVQRRLEATAQALLAEVAQYRPPFDGPTADHWMAELLRVTGRAG